MEKILEITEVKVFTLRTFPPKLQILASGIVRTGGWSNPKLIPYTYIQAPPDGIYDFDFVADPPTGAATQALNPISVEYLWENLPSNLKGVRIHASSNAQVACSEAPDCEGEVPNTQEANRFTLEDAEGTTKVVFFPQALGPLGQSENPSEAQLEYQGPEGQFNFRGAEITQQENVLGSLIAVTLKPNADAGGLSLALALPPVVMLGETRVPFMAIALKVTERGRVINPLGATLSYEGIPLNGVAEKIPIL